jgi:hypothetical protein
MGGLVIVVLVIGLLAILFLATWTVRRHGESPEVDPRWRPTEERFVDPATGRRMRVFLDDEGGRHYVHDGR